MISTEILGRSLVRCPTPFQEELPMIYVPILPEFNTTDRIRSRVFDLHIRDDHRIVSKWRHNHSIHLNDGFRIAFHLVLAFVCVSGLSFVILLILPRLGRECRLGFVVSGPKRSLPFRPILTRSVLVRGAKDGPLLFCHCKKDVWLSLSKRSLVSITRTDSPLIRTYPKPPPRFCCVSL